MLLPSYSNPGIPTLEGTVFEALIKAGAISADNADDHQKVRWLAALCYVATH